MILPHLLFPSEASRALHLWMALFLFPSEASGSYVSGGFATFSFNQ